VESSVPAFESVSVLSSPVAPTSRSDLIPLSNMKVLRPVPRRRFIRCRFLWPPYVIGQAIIFLRCGFFLSSIYLSFFYSSPNLSGRRLDVYHTLVRI